MVGNVLDSVISGAVLYFVTLGLLIIFGMMQVINFAHGAFLTVGAYASVIVTQQHMPTWLALILAPIIAGLLGLALEPTVMRRLYGRQLDTILATWGLTLVITQAITLYFGRGTQETQTISVSSIDVLGTKYSIYRLLLVPLAILSMAGLILLLRHTRYGLVGRAVIMNEDLAQTMGVNTKRVRLVSFTLGSAIAGFAGSLLVPLSSVDPNLGTPWLIDAFMISLLVGISAPALAAATLILGTAQIVVGAAINAAAVPLAVPLLVIVILRARPTGLVRLGKSL